VASTPSAGPAPLPPGIEPAPVWVPPAPSLAEVLAGSAAGTGVALARPLLRTGLPAVLGRPGGPPPASPAIRQAVAADAATADPGWFGPGSTAWKVQADASMYVAGIAAFALQLLHPLALAGVADHGSFAEDFFGRIMRTGLFLQGVTFGGRAEAAARVAQVQRVHTSVVGTAPDGRPYAAGDPELLRWVHLGEYLAIAAAYRRFGAYPLGPAELDRYVDEVAVVGEAMGVPDPPRSWAALDAAVQAYRPSLAVGEQTRAALRFLAWPPGLPAAARPAWRLLWAGGVACVPPWARRLLGVRPRSAPELVACRALVQGLDTLLGEPPTLVAARRRLERP
jgi:uncharacterized protein (DUF2236 family)